MSTETLIEAGNIKPRIQFNADGVQKEFQFFFKIYEPENVKVYIEDAEQTSGYSLSTKEDVQGGCLSIGTKTDPSMPPGRSEAGSHSCPPFPLCGVFCGWPVLDASG